MEHSLVAAIKARAREDLAQRLLHTEGFTMLGSFEDWQGLGGGGGGSEAPPPLAEALALLHASLGRRPQVMMTNSCWSDGGTAAVMVVTVAVVAVAVVGITSSGSAVVHAFFKKEVVQGRFEIADICLA
eukprot:CAMPEP_0171615288 /NCGR_PEP_ID=MMETSP0990-20121206/12809_1 /TAXON_ID=483369 /ORGANISM="non described non described, Strain CCMP2098" /LENGTH=128 /DNA_ID=CAMNT_0012179367 /DNA_START=681 /DNA_END=1063 /DNA_ORIENTATION=-